MRIGIDVGGSHIGVGLVDDFGNIIIKKEKDILKEEKINIQTEITNTAKKYIREILEDQHVQEKISMIGIAFPKSLRGGTIGKAVNLGISGIELKETLEEYFKQRKITYKASFFKSSKWIKVCIDEYSFIITMDEINDYEIRNKVDLKIAMNQLLIENDYYDKIRDYIVFE